MRYDYTILLLALCFLAGVCPAQMSVKGDGPELCRLRQQIRPGEHKVVVISGIYTVGYEASLLDDQSCPNSPYRGTWVEFDLNTQRNNKKLRNLLKHSNKVELEVEGEFYGPPLPDPNLPEALKKNYHPNWGHLGCCRTKLVVHEIRDVKAVEK